jgi:hypothetical protein
MASATLEMIDVASRRASASREVSHGEEVTDDERVRSREEASGDHHRPWPEDDEADQGVHEEDPSDPEGPSRNDRDPESRRRAAPAAASGQAVKTSAETSLSRTWRVP